MFFFCCFAMLSLRPLKFSLDASRASLATETEYVRTQLAAYTNNMISMGVDGLRLDAAKRMSLCCFYSNIFCSRCLTLFVDIKPDDIANIKGRLKGTPYITQEVCIRDLASFYFCLASLCFLLTVFLLVFVSLYRSSMVGRSRQRCIPKMAKCKSEKFPKIDTSHYSFRRTLTTAGSATPPLSGDRSFKVA